MSNKTKPQNDWVGRIVARMDHAARKMPEPYWLKGEWPDWVTNVGRELSKELYKTAKLSASRTWTAGEVGAILGQNLAYTATSAEALEAIAENWNDVPSSAIEEEAKVLRAAAEFFRKYKRDYVPEFGRAMKFAVGLAVKQEHQECEKFFAAFGRAIQRKPIAGHGIGNTATSIYIVLLVFWRSVEKLRSVRELHAVLCKIFGTHLVRDIKRVEKMCQRLGLRLARRGRPTKSQIQNA